MWKQVRRPVSVGGLLIMVIACSPPPSTTAASRQPPVRATASGPCSSPATGDFQRDVPGYTDRRYTAHLPDGYDCRQQYPLIIGLHGAGGTRDGLRQMTCLDGADGPTCLDEMGNDAGYIVVFADGTVDPAFRWGGRVWNAGGGDAGSSCIAAFACEAGFDDIAYLRSLVGDLQRVLAVDPDRIYLAGFSNGAALAHRAACELSETIAAVATVAGANQFAADPDRCAPARPVPVLHIHGDGDTWWPYAGGRSRWNANVYVAVPASVEGWATQHGYDAPTEVIGPIDDVVETPETSYRIWIYRDGSDAADVTHYEVIGGGHAWPGGSGLPVLGVISQEFSANAAVLEFFDGHALVHDVAE